MNKKTGILLAIVVGCAVLGFLVLKYGSERASSSRTPPASRRTENLSATPSPAVGLAEVRRLRFRDVDPDEGFSKEAPGAYREITEENVADLITTFPLREGSLLTTADGEELLALCFALAVGVTKALALERYDELESHSINVGNLDYGFPDLLRENQRTSPNYNWTHLNTESSWLAAYSMSSPAIGTDPELSSLSSILPEIARTPKIVLVLHFQFQDCIGKRNQIRHYFGQESNGEIFYISSRVSNVRSVEPIVVEPPQ